MGARMQRGGVPLLPGEVKEEVGPPADAPDGRPIAISLAEHPLARALGTLPQDLVGEARIVRFMDVAIGPQGRSVLGVGGTGSPLVAEKALGRGKVVLVTTSADRAWTSLPVHPAYPIFLHEAMTYLTTRAHERPFVVGEPVVLPLPSRSVETSVVFRAPDGSDLAVQVTEREGRRVAQYEQTDRPGFYEMKHAQAPGPVVVAANVDPRESDVRSLGAEGLATAMAGLPVRILPPGENVAAAVRESRVGRELWRMLMLAGLAVLALEAYLAWRFSREIGGGEPVTADTGGREGLGAGREAA